MVLEFRYDPVLGLDYFVRDHYPVLVYDVARIPTGFDRQKLLDMLKRDRMIVIGPKFVSASEPDQWEVRADGFQILFNGKDCTIMGRICERCHEFIEGGIVPFLKHYNDCQLERQAKYGMDTIREIIKNHE